MLRAPKRRRRSRYQRRPTPINSAMNQSVTPNRIQTKTPAAKARRARNDAVREQGGNMNQEPEAADFLSSPGLTTPILQHSAVSRLKSYDFSYRAGGSQDTLLRRQRQGPGSSAGGGRRKMALPLTGKLPYAMPEVREPVP